jgi:hypothetical protein
VIHVVFERRSGQLAVFGPDGKLWHALPAAGRIPPGHYRLTGRAEHDPSTPDEGPGAIYVQDLDQTVVQRLLDAGRAKRRDGGIEIARLPGAAGGLMPYRGASAIHGGGAALARTVAPEDPLAPFQRLTPLETGVRVHNADLARLLMILGPELDRNETIVLTVLGETAPRG